MQLTIYHNPACSKSRKTLELIENNGIKPNIIEYLKNPPDAETVIRLAAMLDLNVSEILRTSEAEFLAMLENAALDDEQALAAAIATHPKVLQRPIVVDEEARKAVIGRPPENVLELLSK